MENKQLIGIDIGGHFMKAALVQNGEIVYRIKMPTPIGRNEKAFYDAIFFLTDDIIIKNKLQIGQIGGIGIGIAGMVISQKILLSAVNLGLENINVADIVGARYKVPVKIGNDVSMFALGQARQSKINNLIYVAIGTGINIGVINDGKLFTGANGASIEYGHTCLVPTFGDSCPCGLSGCVEQFVSGNAIMANAKKAGITAATPEEVFAKSKNIADNFLFYLSIVIVNLANTYRPQKIFIGGGLAALIGPYIDKLNAELKQKSYGYKNAPEITVEISQLQNDAAIIGAASLLFL